MECYSASKREKMLTCCMNFEDITISEISLTQKDKYCMIPFT